MKTKNSQKLINYPKERLVPQVDKVGNNFQLKTRRRRKKTTKAVGGRRWGTHNNPNTL